MKRVLPLLLPLACFAASGMEESHPAKLEIAGYPSALWRLVLTWEESANNGTLVQGYHLQSLTDERMADVYFDERDKPLLDKALQELDIPIKHWDAPSLTIPSEVVPGFPKTKKTSPVQPWLSLSSENRVETVLVAPNGAEEFESHAEDTAAKGLTRYGSVMDLQIPLSIEAETAAFGEWHDFSDGRRVWSATVRVLDAVGLRLHFATLALPPGATLVVYGPDSVHPVELVTVAASGWGPSCFNEAITLECRLPAGVSADGVIISVDRIGRMYKLPFDKAATVGGCNINVACRPEWLTLAMAVGRLAKADSDGLWACTGTLVADTLTDSQIPYFLTANHCVKSQADADSIEVYWLFQAENCDATPPDMDTVPRTTGGADYLAGSSNSSGTDFAFLRLNHDPPDGLTRAGYSTEAAAVGTDVTVIHHPQGQHKRISFGAITDTGSPGSGQRLKPIERFHEVKWQAGTTEPGSSGCPLFGTSNPVIIGQLYGGYASCGAVNEPDYFGRLDVTYPLIEKWLSPSASTEGEDGGGGDGCQWFKASDPSKLTVAAGLVGLLMLAGMLGRGPRP